MSAGQIVNTAAIFCALAIIAGSAWVFLQLSEDIADDDIIASLYASQKRVEILRPGQERWQLFFPPADLYEMDSIRTDRNSRAVIKYPSGISLMLDPESRITLSAVHKDEDDKLIHGILLVEGSAGGTISREKIATGRKAIQISQKEGLSALLTPIGPAEDSFIYKVVAVEGEGIEIFSYSGTAFIQAGDQSLIISSESAVISGNEEEGYTISSPLPLPEPPHLHFPGSEAQINLEDPLPAVEFLWRPVNREYQHFIQVSDSHTFDTVIDEKLTEDNSYLFFPNKKASFFWRIASIDNKNRRGNFTSPRRFSILSIPVQKHEEDEKLKWLNEFDQLLVRFSHREGRNRKSHKEPGKTFLPRTNISIPAQIIGEEILLKSGEEENLVSGNLDISAEDVIYCKKSAVLRLGTDSIINIDPETSVEFNRTGKVGNRIFLAITLKNGGLRTDLGPQSKVHQLLIHNDGIRVLVTNGDSGSRIRIIDMNERLRIITEKGTATVRTELHDHLLNSGQAIEQPKRRSEARLLAIPENPVLSAPPDNARLVSTGLSPPEIIFSWEPVRGSNSYILRIESRGKLFFQGSTVSPEFVHTAIPSGNYRWRVYSVSNDGVESLQPPSRSFSVLGSGR